MNVDQSYGAGKEAAVFSPFSPRIRGIDAEKYPDDWASHQKTRQAHLDALMERDDLLSLLWISYWANLPTGVLNPRHLARITARLAGR